MRRLSFLVLAPTVLLLAACGGGSSSIGSTATETAEDPFAELRFVLAKFPYEPWYRDCIVEQVEDKLSVAELEELAELPEEQGRRVALRFALGAAPRCEARGRKPIRKNPTHVQVQLLRIGYASTLEALGKRQGLDAKQAKCLSRTIAAFPDEKIVALGNASEGKREKILV
ncbi:MAG TPA: hypothetical protein VEB65_02785, partial [Solirubrobacterales bacterium]|nr:hypothetical protein [Solirubrobacterales bacterium]